MPVETLADAAYEHIRRKIVDQTYPLGSRLREDLIAEELGMSRTPVREAINRLAMAGLVENVPHTGVFIVNLSREEILDLIDLREALEVVAIGKAVDRIRDDQLEELRKNVEEYAQACADFDFDRAYALDRSFHEMIVLACGTPRIPRYFDELADLIHIARSLACPNRASLDRALADHRQIFDGLAARDKKIAILALRLHLRRVRARFQQSACLGEGRKEGDSRPA